MYRGRPAQHATRRTSSSQSTAGCPLDTGTSGATGWVAKAGKTWLTFGLVVRTVSCRHWYVFSHDFHSLAGVASVTSQDVLK